MSTRNRPPAPTTGSIFPTRTLLVALVAIAITVSGCAAAEPDASKLSNSSTTETGAATGTAEPSATPAPKYQAFPDLAVGDCFNPVSDMDDDSLIAGLMLTCTEPHLMQVFGTEVLNAPSGEPYPGVDEVDAQAWNLCLPAFEQFVGIAFDDSRLTAVYYYPPPDAWLADDRSVLCVIEATEAAPLTRSVQGSEL